MTGARMGIKAVTTKVVSHSQTTGAPLDRITLTWSVPFTDLDLRSQSGAIELPPLVMGATTPVAAAVLLCGSGQMATPQGDRFAPEQHTLQKQNSLTVPLYEFAAGKR